MKNWKVLHKLDVKDNELSTQQVLGLLLENRGLTKKEDVEVFLDSSINLVTLKSSEIDIKEFEKFKSRIFEAIEKDEKIIIYGDYDVDGICASAILWETLFTKTKNVLPYIPSRVDEGYGLSKKGIDNVLMAHPDTKVIITVDNGIVSFDAVSYAREKGIDVVVTDHHVKKDILPDAYCILHTTFLCGAGISWVIAKELAFEDDLKIYNKLELAALATVADLVPLMGNNRAIVKEGIKILRKTKRIGLISLFREVGIESSSIGTYAIGYLIAPRINASGRIESAMNGLRLLCTNNEQKAVELSSLLESINRERQTLTQKSSDHAKLLSIQKSYSTRITIVADKSYNQGIIGLIASRMVESYYKPAFAISIGEKVSKGSARSIAGVNIIELLRSISSTLIEAGGHPMAAGFSIETKRIDEFAIALSQKAEEVVKDELMQRTLKIDLEIPFDLVSEKLIKEISKLEPFGMGNPEPIFATYDVVIVEARKIGKDQSHLKLKVKKNQQTFDAVAFKMADKYDLSTGDIINIAYTINENEWNGKKSLQLKIKDILLV